MIEVNAVRAGILRIPSCTIHPGICAITGPNGSGKTTFLKLLAGILSVEQGIVLINGKKNTQATIGWVGEYPERNMLFTRVFDELASPLRFARYPCKEIDTIVRNCADILGISHLLDRDNRGLSGGELVLVAFGAAIITKPDLLILDETDSHLDDEFCSHLDLIMKKSGIEHVVFTTHRPERMAVADDFITLEKGRIRYYSSLSQPGDQIFHERMNDPWFWKKISGPLSYGEDSW